MIQHLYLLPQKGIFYCSIYALVILYYSRKIIITILNGQKILIFMNTTKIYQAHPYHLVEPSPWPLAASLALLIITTSAVLNFHGWSTSVAFATGLFSLLATMGFWWRDCIRESS
jgi:hypothetical protein